MARYENNPLSTRAEFLRRYGPATWFDVGDHTFGHPNIQEPGWGNLRVGRYCSFAPESTCILASHANHVTTYPFRSLPSVWGENWHLTNDHESKGDIEIGADVSIGYRATILSGATIGAGAIIGPGSIVSGNIPPFAIVLGAPGRVIDCRFGDAQVEALLRIRWWDWPDELVQQRIPMIASGNIAAFVAQFDPAAIDQVSMSAASNPSTSTASRSWWTTIRRIAGVERG